LQTAVVGRKTPGDGKLEIAIGTAGTLRALGSELRLRVVIPGTPPRSGDAIVTSMPCTCAKAGAAGRHEHHFLESPLLRMLAAGTPLSLVLEGTGEVVLTVTDPGMPR
jgi:hypothetical protein